MSTNAKRLRRSWSEAACTLALTLAGCLEPKSEQPAAERTCTACHGDERRSGEALDRAAPPADLDGSDNPSTMGVGAHERHLSRRAHAAVVCQACHVVPESVFAPGHVDTTFPAEVTFGGLAVQGARQPSYDRERRACTNTYCHANATVDWTAPREEKEACGTCHGSPPALPHPQKTDCSECHGDVIGRDGQWGSPERHVDGKVDVNTSAKCATCHGDDPATGAPPPDLAGQRTPNARAVGAHSNHLLESVTHRPIECSECHRVPADVQSPGHLDGDGRAEVVFGRLAKAQRRRPSYDGAALECSDTYCHGPTTGEWNAPRAPRAACGSCHGLPPPPPHSPITQCSNCHARVVTPEGAIKEPGLHVNGSVEVDFASECTSCHGTPTSAAPPRDLQGNVQPAARGVGAHTAHVVQGTTHSAVECRECHVVPATVAAPGHLDGDGTAEIVFGPLASALAHRPAYDPSVVGCSGTYCHRDAEPNWLAPRSSEAACGSCHALPPVSPHPANDDCSTCHTGIDPLRKFVSPELHVNGRVDLLPMPCNGCHGDTPNGAPPADTMGNRSPSARGVGAHDRHLQASATHGPVACSECHVVPAQVNSEGHRDTALPAEVTFGGLATAHLHTPSYSPSLLTCAGSYCHGQAAPDWIQPRDAAQTCGSCHGIPPAGLHPQRSDCGTCHSAVMDLAGNFIAPERHVDGTLELDPMRCNTCHGSTADGAPPTDIGGGEATNLRGVGAHAAHLRASETHGPIACSECHVVPAAWDSPGHADTPLPAEITFGALAMSSGARPRYLGDTVSCAGTYCHGGSTPVWTGPRTSEQACGSCHALPPALPHPQTNDCSVCHGAVIDAQRRFVMPDLHVDGRVQVEQTCTACHGSATNSAPPMDLSGGSEPTRLGVGAHQIHLSGGNSSRPLACGECHPVPSTITSAGHLDLQLATPADVVFVGPAAADNRNPRWDRGSATCSGSYCHGPSDPLNASPKWVTAVGGLQCTSCHGWPPAPPHSADTRCGRCHSDVDAQGTIVDRALHVNGEVDLL